MDYSKDLMNLSILFNRRMQYIMAMHAVKWEEVAVDTPVMVWATLHNIATVPGTIGHFAGVEKGSVTIYNSGKTSLTSHDNCRSCYDYALPLDIARQVAASLGI